jgi:very-short-patch-repair endonuclease
MDFVQALKSDPLTSHVNIAGTPHEPLFQANTICKLIGIKHAHSTLRYFVFDKDKVVLHAASRGGIQRTLYLTVSGLTKLVCITRKAEGLKLAEILKLKTNECKIISVEEHTIKQIMTAFDGETMHSQHYVSGYRIDLYFPEYRLAIECDECHHQQQKNSRYDKVREDNIKQILDCEFIRYAPQQPDFDMFLVINRIFKHIQTRP